MSEPEPLQQVDRTYVWYRGGKLSYFAGCDYFRMSTHPRVNKALKVGVERFGLNVAASRLTTGNHVLYRELEEKLADFFGAPDALMVANGYMAGIIAAEALAGTFSHALLDEKAHPSLWDAARFLDCPMLQFKHRDLADFARAVNRCGRMSRLLVLTDGLFAHDGSVAPLKEYLNLLPKDGVVLLDDAHAAGILGRRGRGMVEHAQVSRRQVIQAVTLSKAFGIYGGAILGSKALRNRLIRKSRSYAASTPMPLPLVNAALEALKILKRDQSFTRRLVQNTQYVREALSGGGFNLPAAPGPILALHYKRATVVSELKRALLAARIHPPFICYPGGPKAGYFRFVISSEHSLSQLDRLVKVLNSKPTFRQLV